MCVFKHDAMHMFEGVEVLIHWLLASALHAVESSFSCFWRLLRAHNLGWWDGLARQWSSCEYGPHLNACALVTLQPWWCNGCSRLAPANSYYKRVSFSFGLVLCPPRLLASTSVRLAHEDVIARVKPNPTQFVFIFREYHFGIYAPSFLYLWNMKQAPTLQILAMSKNDEKYVRVTVTGRKWL